ncbi:MAG: hypothetical protein CL823_05830 [Crocinitomicaceae bacterium]|nr:hypothetical protein [Crocinitomicaceae bacterium]
MQDFRVKTVDGLSLVARDWNAKDASSNRTLLIIHGLGEHQGRYAHVAEHFINDGYKVYSYDQRGHGLSDGKKGHSSGIDSNLDDLEAVIKEIDAGDLFLYGHSFGGNVLANFLLRREQKNMKAALLSGAWMRLHKEPSKVDVLLATAMNSIYPSFSQNNKIDETALSHRIKVGEDYLNDPLVHNKITAGLFKSFYASGVWAAENSNRLKIPTLVIHGADDTIVGLRGSEEFARNSGGVAELKIYSETRHELHNDNKCDEVLKDVSEFFSRQ